MRSCSPNNPELLRRCRPLLGTYVEVAADDERAIEAAFAVVALVHQLMSFQSPQSELTRINDTRPGRWTACHPWTAKVLRRAGYWKRASRRAFDPCVNGRWAGVELAPGRVRRAGPEAIDLSGIAKGFAIDRAVAALGRAGARSGLVNAGGDLRVFGAEQTVALLDPATRTPAVEVVLRNQALATSAAHEGGDADHVRGARAGWTSASVVAPSAMDADALTKVVLADSPHAIECLRRAGGEALRLGPNGWEEMAPQRRAA